MIQSSVLLILILINLCAQRLQLVAKARTKLREQAECAPIVNMNCLLHVKNVQSEEPEISLKAVAVHESEARTAVMEMMVLAGQVAAKWASAKGVPVLYRYHNNVFCYHRWCTCEYCIF
jgi:exoribonuclease R